MNLKMMILKFETKK